MSDRKNIVWLASYPKSGNTWFRAFLTALLSEDNDVHINNLWSTYNFNDSKLFESVQGLNASELLINELNELRRDTFFTLSEFEKENLYVKIHKAYSFLEDGLPAIPTEVTKVALYFVRNPLDVAVSLAHHSSFTIDESINYMGCNSVLSKIKSGAEFFLLPALLQTWHQHVSSWIYNPSIKVEIIKYEDMHNCPLDTFKRAVKAIGLSYDSQRIMRAIECVTFDKLKEQELKNKFREKPPNAENFFRKGKIGSWKEEMNKQQIQQIINNHGKMMYKLGYL